MTEGRAPEPDDVTAAEDIEPVDDITVSPTAGLIVPLRFRGEELERLRRAARSAGRDINAYVAAAINEAVGRELARRQVSEEPVAYGASPRDALNRYEAALRAAGKAESTIQTYVDRARRFLDWLDGRYRP